jgi:hypothetical protein
MMNLMVGPKIFKTMENQALALPQSLLGRPQCASLEPIKQPAALLLPVWDCHSGLNTTMKMTVRVLKMPLQAMVAKMGMNK